MVCKHKSEWSYSWSKIEEDGKKFLKYHHPDASDDKIKERLKETKTKYDALYDFWDKLNFKTDTFWYFEPFAWVEQMKRVFGVSKWRNPVDNPQITIYTSGGNKRPWRSAFGYVRQDLKRNHHGLDLFAIIGTPVYACLPGKIVRIINDVDGYGDGFILKVDKDYLEEFKNQRRDYEPYYVKSKRLYSSKEYDTSGYNYDFEEYEGIKESDNVFLAYAHLSEVNVTLNQIITSDEYQTKILGRTGDTGKAAKGTKGPHLHFEIRSVVAHKKEEDKYTNLYNPAYYIDYKNENQLTKEEREIQDKTAGK